MSGLRWKIRRAVCWLVGHRLVFFAGMRFAGEKPPIYCQCRRCDLRQRVEVIW